MTSMKRTASQAQLPLRNGKQPRMSPDIIDSHLDPSSSAKPSRPTLLSRWIALGKDTAAYFLGGSENVEWLPTTYSQSPRRSVAPQRPPAPSTSQPKDPPDTIFSLPSLPTEVASTSTAPSLSSLFLQLPATPPPMSRFSSFATSTPESSTLQSPTSMTMMQTSDIGTLEQLLSKDRAMYRVLNGVQNGYHKNKHIHSKLHKARVQEALERRLFELQRERGYSSDFETFRGFLAYRQRLQELQRRESSPHLRDDQDNRRKHELNARFGRAVEKAKKSLESPRPPLPFSPSMDQLRLTTRARDDAILIRLRPKRKPLPDRLPDDIQAEVHDFFCRRGVISRAAKEQVSDKDLSRLRPNQWLNDELINFYGQLIMDRSMEAEAAKENGKKYLNVHYFSTFFWPKLLSGYEKGRLAKWTKKLDIFSKDVILIPVNHNNSHWTAAAINFRRKRIESYDSMDMDRSDVYKRLRSYLDEEHKNKRKKPFDFQGWQDYVYEYTPQQENGVDCGVFTCQFLETLSRGEEEFNFSQRDMPYLRQRMVWEIGRARLADDLAR